MDLDEEEIVLFIVITTTFILILLFLINGNQENVGMEEEDDDDVKEEEEEEDDDDDEGEDLELLTHKFIFKKKIEERFDEAIQEAITTTYQSLKHTDFSEFLKTTGMSKKDAGLMIEYVLKEMKVKY